MNRFEYYAYYDGTPTVSDAHRSTRSDDEIRGLLNALHSHLADHFPQGTKIDVAEVQQRAVRGDMRLTRQVTVSTDMEKKAALDLIERAFNELHLFGERAQ
ncbi:MULTISPECIES: hypothetical protein [Ralstonia solanacearum species complex]|uniref:hypothetical protein n=1 Tax=Ralstonia solanacearum species complex TaxID=3116862 RepID=UPI0018D0C769|nr:MULTISPECIES: hypothetical protein [Ralstonia solanacearum species complex]MDN3368271.1 hypothetical protein [Ralstonia pseudosolanacearum]